MRGLGNCLDHGFARILRITRINVGIGGDPDHVQERRVETLNATLNMRLLRPPLASSSRRDPFGTMTLFGRVIQANSQLRGDFS